MFDIIIIGAGPAGTTASIILSRAGYRVLLLEKSRFPRDKLCGEFISPECIDIFERLEVIRQIFDAGAQSYYHWTFYAPDGRSVEMPIEWIAGGHSRAIGITRARMDLILLNRAREAGVEVLEGIHISSKFSRRENLGMIEGKADGERIIRFSAPIIIDASGRNGVFSGLGDKSTERRSLFRGSRLFGCKVYLRGVEGLGERGELFFFGDGYGGLSDVEDGRTNLCFLTTEATLLDAKGDREKLLDLTLRSNPAAARRLTGATIDSEWLGTGPINFGRHQTIPGVLAIGDAGAFIDPFTGSGILLALGSGELAANLIIESSSEGIDEIGEIARRFNKLHRAQFGLRYRASSLLRGLAFKPAARNALITLLSRHQSLMKIVAMSATHAWKSTR